MIILFYHTFYKITTPNAPNLVQKNKRDKNYLALYLSTTLCIAQQNLSKSVNVVSKGSPSRILIVLLISFGITTRPRSSMRRTIPVAFIYKNSLLYKFVLLVSVKQGDLYCVLNFILQRTECYFLLRTARHNFPQTRG